MNTRMVLGLLLIALLLAGCVGGNTGTKGAPSAPAAKPAPAAGNPSAQQTPSTAAPTPAPAPTAAPAGGDLMATWQKLLTGKAQEYRVQYKMTLGQTGENLLEEYVKGGVQRRTDMRLEGSGFAQNLRVFYLQDGGTVTCMVNKDKELCFKSEAENAAQSPQQQYDVKNYEPKLEDFLPGQSSLTKEPSRVIAGQPTDCFKIRYAKKETVEMVGCYTSDGIAMYMESLGGDSKFRMEAQKLERSVADSDLVAPPAQSMEELYGQGSPYG